MTLRILRIFPIAALMVLFAVGTFYAQEHAEHNAKHANAKSDVPEIFCSHMGTGQLCPGNADMFKLSGAKKQAYLEALDSYHKAVAAASKQFAADARAKAGPRTGHGTGPHSRSSIDAPPARLCRGTALLCPRRASPASSSSDASQKPPIPGAQTQVGGCEEFQ